MGPLEGVRVVDLTSVLMGPYATQLLGEYGADVIKVEPFNGDLVRDLGPTRNPRMGAVYLNANRGKRSIAIDLKTAAGQKVMNRLLEQADVFVTNVRPKALARIGLAASDLGVRFERLVVANLVGYGQQGPYADRPAYDDLIQGGSGFSDLMAQASDGVPRYAPNALADRVVGLSALNAILAALLARERSGSGQQVEIPMFETMTQFVLGDHLGGHTYVPSEGPPGYARHLSPDRRPYQTSDGYLCALVYNDKQWRSFLGAIEQSDLLEQFPYLASFGSRAENIDAVTGLLASLFKTRSTEQWSELLESADVPYMKMHDLDSILDDPHLAAVDFFRTVNHPSEGAIRVMRTPIRWSKTPVSEPPHAPELGEQTDQILRDSGFSDQEIASFNEADAVRSNRSDP
ncbi:MAG: CaiB/BaiF CoA transferase family protein [Burkholderiaceae bacterium]